MTWSTVSKALLKLTIRHLRRGVIFKHVCYTLGKIDHQATCGVAKLTLTYCTVTQILQKLSTKTAQTIRRFPVVWCLLFNAYFIIWHCDNRMTSSNIHCECVTNQYHTASEVALPAVDQYRSSVKRNALSSEMCRCQVDTNSQASISRQDFNFVC